MSLGPLCKIDISISQRWNLRLKKTEFSKITKKHGNPIQFKETWLQTQDLSPTSCFLFKTGNKSLIVKVQAPCQYSFCLLKGSSVACFSASLQTPPPFLMLKLFFSHRCAGDLEKAETPLCFYCPAPDVSCRSLSHLPVIILFSIDRVMAPGRGLFHQSSQLLMSFMLLLRPQLPSHSPPPNLLSHLHLAAGDW